MLMKSTSYITDSRFTENMAGQPVEAGDGQVEPKEYYEYLQAEEPKTAPHVISPRR